MNNKNWAVILIIQIFFCQTIFGQERGVVVSVKQANGLKREEILYRNSYALLIGNSNYAEWNSLPGVERDIPQVEKVLREKHGFVVEKALNLSKKDLISRIDQFISKYGQSFDNRLLIYYAGHGYTTVLPDGRVMGYLVMKDAPVVPPVEEALLRTPKNFSDFRLHAISMDDIENSSKAITTRHALFVFDSCFSGTVLYRDNVIGIPPEISPEELEQMRGFLTAGNEKQRVRDDSPFRRAFIKGLEGPADRDGDGFILSSELGAYVKREVYMENRDTSTPQSPIFDKQANFRRGDMIFITPQGSHGNLVRRTPDFGPITNADDVELEAFLGVQNSKDLNAIRAVLNEYPNSRFAPSLRNKLDRLVWESIKNSHDQTRIQRYLDEFGNQAQFASLARIELRKLATPGSTLGTGSNPGVSSTVSSDTKVGNTSKPDEARELANSAFSEIIMGNDKAALKLADDSLRLNLKMPLAIAVRGWARYQLKIDSDNYVSFIDALRIEFEKALKLEPKNMFFNALLIDVYDDLYKGGATMKTVNRIISSLGNPQSASDFFARGLAYRRKGDKAKAIDDFSRAIDLEPKFAHAYFSRATVRIDDFETARADLLKANTINPRFSDPCGGGRFYARCQFYSSLSNTHRDKALAFSEEEKYAEAISEFNRAIEVYPALFHFQNRGLAYYNKGDYDAAIRDFDVVIENSPNWSGLDVYFYRASSYFGKRDYDKAIAGYTESIKRDPSAAGYPNRGSAYFNKEEYEVAIRDYTKAIELDQNYGYAYRNRADAYERTGRARLAESDRQMALAADQRKAAENAKKAEDCACPTSPTSVIKVN